MTMNSIDVPSAMGLEGDAEQQGQPSSEMPMGAGTLEKDCRRGGEFAVVYLGPFQLVAGAWEQQSETVAHGLHFPVRVTYKEMCGSLCRSDTAPYVLVMRKRWKTKLEEVFGRQARVVKSVMPI